MSDNITVRSLLIDFVKGANKVAEEAVKLGAKREGTYSNMVRAAILAKSPEVLEKDCQSVMDDIRSNRDGLAKSLKCKAAKRQPKDQPKTRPVFTVPGSFTAAKSYMLDALRYNVVLTDEDGETPRPYSQIRENVREIKEAAARAALSGTAKLKAEITETLAAIQARTDSAPDDKIGAIHEAVTAALATVREACGIDAMRAARKADKADETVTELDEIVPEPVNTDEAAKSARASKKTGRKSGRKSRKAEAAEAVAEAA